MPTPIAAANPGASASAVVPQQPSHQVTPSQTGSTSAPARQQNVRSDFKNAIAVDSSRLRAKILKSRAVGQAPLVAHVPLLAPNRIDSIDDRRAHFETLFAAAIETFEKDVTPETIGTLRPGGRLARYVETTGYSLAMRAHMNAYLGLVHGLDQAKRTEGLNALLSLEEGDLNCVDGMIERIDFLRTALIGNASLLDHVYAASEEKVIWGDAAAVNVHEANRRKAQMLTWPTREDASALEKHSSRQIEQFLERDVRELIRDLRTLVDAAPGAEGKAAAIQAFQEAHLPTLRWFFPPPQEGKLTKKAVTQHVTQLHQHPDYFRLDEDTYDYAAVEHVAILRDAIRAVLPALSMQSKIMIMHKNPDLWEAMKMDMFPAYLARCPDLGREEFLTELVEFFEIPRMIKNGSGIGNLIVAGVVPLDKLFKIRADDIPADALFTFNENTCPLVDLMMEPGRDPGDIEMLLEQCIRKGRTDLLDILESRCGAEINSKVELILNAVFLMKPGFTPSLENQARLLEACKTVQTVENDALRTRLQNQVSGVVLECLRGPADIERQRGLDFLAQFMQLIALEPATLAQFHCQTLLAMQRAENPAQHAFNLQVIDLVARNTDSVNSHRLGTHRVDVLLKLVEVMGKLPAVLPGVSPNCQLVAYKLIKRRLAEMQNHPANTLKLVRALWEGDTIERLGSATNRLPVSRLTKFVNAVGGALPLAMQDQPASGIQQAVMRLTPATLVRLRQANMRGTPARQLALMRKIDAAWGAAIAKVGRTAEPAAGTMAAELARADSDPIPADQAALLVSAYLKEFDPLNFPDIEPAVIDAARAQALDRIDTERMQDLLPTMYRTTKVAYFDVAAHLLQRQAVGARLPQTVVDSIKDGIRNLDGPGGKLNRLRAKEAAVKLRHTLMPPWLRPEKGFIEGSAASHFRMQTIQEARSAQLARIAQKRQRLLDTRDRIVAAMQVAGAPDGAAASNAIDGIAGSGTAAP